MTSTQGWLFFALLAILAAPFATTAMPESVTIPPVEERPSGGLPAASFSHWEHDRYKCYACHPSLFPERPLAFTHADMAGGGFCADCHNGNVAWAVAKAPEGCASCHAGGS